MPESTAGPGPASATEGAWQLQELLQLPPGSVQVCSFTDRPGHRLEVNVNQRELEPAVAAIARPLVAEHGFSLTGADVHLESQGSASLAFRADLAVVRGTLRAVVQISGTAAVAADLSLSLSGLRATSANPLVAMGLGVLTWDLQRMQEGCYAPPEDLTAGLDVGSASVSVDGGEVRLAAELTSERRGDYPPVEPAP